MNIGCDANIEQITVTKYNEAIAQRLERSLNNYEVQGIHEVTRIKIRYEVIIHDDLLLTADAGGVHC
jgi:hypothetical protein